MANSFVRYTGDGSTAAYAIPFSYRSTDDLTVTISGIETTAYTLDGAGTTLTFNTAPADQSAIEIRRYTSQTTKLVDYSSGSVLTENDLDTDSDQAFYMSQEAIDKAGDVISLDNTDFQWDVQSKRLKNVAAPTADNDAVNKAFISTNLPNITTVAGISDDVTTVAGIESDVTTVATNDTNISTVATNISSVNTVATNIADVIKVADDLNEAISEVETVANDLNEATSEIEVVANNITNVNTVGTNITNVNTVAGNDTNITTVAGNNANISTVAGISGNVTTVAGISSDVTAVAADATDIGAVSTDIANVNTVAGSISNVNTVAGNNANVTTVAGINSDVTTVAGISSDVSTVSTNNANVTTVAGSISNVNSVAGSITNVNSVATNLSSVNNFAEVYRISATAPTTSLDDGDMWFDTTASKLKIWNGASFDLAGSSINGTSARFKYVATASQTVFTGTDANGNTLAYDAGYIDVYLNGVHLDPSDYTATDGSTITLNSGATLNDELYIVGFGTFSVADFDASGLTGTLNIARIADGSITNAKLATPFSLTNPTITSISPSTITNSASNIVITGTNYVITPLVEIISTSGKIYFPNTVTRDSATQITINATIPDDGTYFIRVENPDGLAVRSSTALLTVSDAPTWSTSAGSLGSLAQGGTASFSVSASSDSAVTYSYTGALPTGLSLNSSTGAITGTESGSDTAETTYNFTITATDAESQTADRAFSITVTTGINNGGQFN
jgi:hypothetical protein